MHTCRSLIAQAVRRASLAPAPSAKPGFRRLGLACLTALFAGPGSWAAQLTVLPLTGLLSVGSGFSSEVLFNGSVIRAGALKDGVREYLVLGDLNLGAGDRVTTAPHLDAVGVGAAGVRFLVGNDANLRGTFDFAGRNDGRAAAGGGFGGGNGTGGSGAALALNRTLTNRGSGGALGAADKAVFGFDILETYEWHNTSGGYSGANGSAGGWGADGVGGTRGSTGTTGGIGFRGLNNQAPALAAGGAGAQGGAGGNRAGAGRGGTAGNGGAGARLQAAVDTTLSYERVAQPGGSGTRGADGHWGGAGAAGNFGSAGSNATRPAVAWLSFANQTVRNRDAKLVGGNGGGTGGGGGQGGQGGGAGQGGGGGGGGGDNYCDGYCGLVGTFGTTQGGNGGAGGSGGAGAAGGQGGIGGGGGGALEIVARGTITLGGQITVAGGNGSEGQSGLAGSAGEGGRGGESGAPALRLFLTVSAGGASGAGGNGGSGGAGGTGGVGGTGGGGGGGTVRLVASRIVDERPAIDVLGGANHAGTAARGRIYYGSNENNRLVDPNRLTARIVDDTSLLAFGTRGANPFVRDGSGTMVETPFISGSFNDGTALFAGGAERFGAVSRPVVQEASALVQELRDQAPAGGFAALARRSTFVGLAMPGYDALVMVNLSTDVLSAPWLMVLTSPLVRAHKQPLLSGGWETAEEFGGSGANPLTELESEGIYLTFLPTGSHFSGFGFGAGGVDFVSLGSLTLDGSAVYLIGSPVPEPASLVLMACGVAALLARRRIGR